jgi:hypothetical protein
MKFVQDKKDFYSSIETFSDYIEFKFNYKQEKIEAYIPYEGVSNDTIEHKRNTYWMNYYFAGLFVFIVSCALAIANPGFGTVALLSLGLVLKGYSEQKKNRYDLISLPCAKYNIVLIKNSDSEIALKELHKIKSKYIREKYFKINWENEMVDELNKMAWLKSNNIISETEFEDVKKQITSK